MNSLPTRTRTLVEQAVGAALPVLLEGEIGTGKTRLADLIHRLGPRADKPFVPVNCATLAPSLLTAELFGHERGAYTDARESRAGLVEAADKGTLFLDEIAEIPLEQQSKLLTLVEEGWVRRVGGTRRIPIDIRLLSATSRNLAELVAQGEFRDDLYYRCCGFRILVPPLRDRRECIPAIVRDLVNEIVAQNSGNDRVCVPEIDSEALKFLCSHPWLGNIRQLKNVLLMAFLNSGGGAITLKCLPQEMMVSPEQLRGGGRTRNPTMQAHTKRRYVPPQDPREERRRIVTALEKTGGNRTQAARLLGMARQVLWERMRLYQIDEREWRHAPN